jgi:hypothetical protein
MRVFTSLLFGIILAAGPAVVSSRAQTPGSEPTPKTKKHKAKHAKTKKPKKEKTSS